MQTKILPSRNSASGTKYKELDFRDSKTWFHPPLKGNTHTAFLIQPIPIQLARLLRRSLKVVPSKILNHLQLVQLSTGDDGFHKYNNLGYVQRLKELYQKFSSAAAQSRTTQKCWTYLATRSVLDQFHFSLFWLRQVLQFTSLPGASGLGAKSVLAHVQISLIYGRPHCSLFFPVFFRKRLLSHWSRAGLH